MFKAWKQIFRKVPSFKTQKKTSLGLPLTSKAKTLENSSTSAQNWFKLKNNWVEMTRFR